MTADVFARRGIHRLQGISSAWGPPVSWWCRFMELILSTKGILHLVHLSILNHHHRCLIGLGPCDSERQQQVLLGFCPLLFLLCAHLDIISKFPFTNRTSTLGSNQLTLCTFILNERCSELLWNDLKSESPFSLWPSWRSEAVCAAVCPEGCS